MRFSFNLQFLISVQTLRNGGFEKTLLVSHVQMMYH